LFAASAGTICRLNGKLFPPLSLALGRARAARVR